MALLIKNKYYLKINTNGEYLIYESEKNRVTVKNSVNFITVLKKYSEIIYTMLNDVERRYYDPSFSEEIQSWVDESVLYRTCIDNGDTTKKFPLMKKYFKDINNTIPKIVRAGKLGIKANSLEEMYTKIKQLKIFGNEDEIEGEDKDLLANKFKNAEVNNV